ncbi:hypothetical protein FQA39_LY17866 [Lamprigera yunnana]|nr:hypothetical protein FQA39_LY17866 [Lamprigera yunnana]
MPGCCVPECRNRSKDGCRLFRVPTATNVDLRRKVWLDYINRRELPTRALICEVHFNDDQFEMNRKYNRKLLKKSAVLTRSLKRKRTNDDPRNLEGETSPSAEVISSKQGNFSGIMSIVDIKLDELWHPNFTEAVKQSLYYLLGNTTFSFKKSACVNCIATMTYPFDNLNEFSELTTLKSSKGNILIYLKLEVFNYFLGAEEYFRKFKLDLLSNKIHYEDISKSFLLYCSFNLISNMLSTLRGKHLTIKREMAFNVYQWIKSQNEDQCTKEIKEKVSRTTGVSVRTIERIIKEGSTSSEAETDKKFKSP